MRLAYIINNLLFVVPCILLLLLVFWDQLKTPTLLRIVTGASVFLAGSFLGTYVYFIFESPAQHLVISVVFMFSGVLILDSACKYNFWQSLFIISVIKSYSEDVRFLSLDFYFLFTGTLPKVAVFVFCFMNSLLYFMLFGCLLVVLPEFPASGAGLYGLAICVEMGVHHTGEQ